MSLLVQVQSIIYAFLVGLGYGITFSFKEYLGMYTKGKLLKGCFDILYHVLFVCIVYVGLIYVNGGISRLYLFLFFLLGIYLFYLFYYDLFIKFYKFFLLKLKPIYKKSYLLFLRYYSIMLFVKERKRKHGKKKSKKSKQNR